MAELEATVALVTGASSGIGDATAKALARHGAKVAVAARRKDRLDALAAVVIEADITQRDEAVGAVERTVRELGRLDTVINNAGVMLLGDAAEAPLEQWERMVAMVNVSSIAGRVARRGSGVYNLTKHGVGAFSESLTPSPTSSRAPRGWRSTRSSSARRTRRGRGTDAWRVSAPTTRHRRCSERHEKNAG